MDKDGYISNGELFQVLKMMVGNNLKDTQLQQIVDKTIIHADTDGDGKISFEEFCAVSKLYGFFKYLFLVCVLDVEKQHHINIPVITLAFCGKSETSIIKNKMLSNSPHETIVGNFAHVSCLVIFIRNRF